jgi:hypothetical protein
VEEPLQRDPIGDVERFGGSRAELERGLFEAFWIAGHEDDAGTLSRQEALCGRAGRLPDLVLVPAL